MYRLIVLLAGLVVAGPAWAVCPSTPGDCPPMTTNNPTIVGVVAGGATYTAPTITGGTISATDLGLGVLTATGGTAARKPAAIAADVTNILSFAGIDPTGVTDSTAGINTAIAIAATNNLYWPCGTYKFSSTLIYPAGQVWHANNRTCDTLTWAGGNNTALIASVADGSSLESGIEDFTIDAGTATGITILHLQNARQGIYRNLYLKAENGTGNNCLVLEAGVGGLSFNTAHNRFYNIRADGCTKGLYFLGQSGSQVATDNWFYGSDFALSSVAAGTGIDFGKWADTNFFYGLRLTAEFNGSSYLIFNSQDPTGTQSIYNENLYGVIFDNIGTLTGLTGMAFNASRQIYVQGIYNNENTFPGNFITTNSSAGSYCVFLNNANVGSSAAMASYKHACGDELLPRVRPRSMDAGTFTHTPTAGGALVGKAVGQTLRLYVTPFWVADTSTLKSLTINVTTGCVADCNIEMGVYTDNGFGVPNALIANSDTGAVVVTAASTGDKTSLLNGSTGISLTRGMYWAAFSVDAAMSVKSVGPTSGACDLIGLGSSTLAAAEAQTGCGAWQFGSLSSLGTLPSTFGTFTGSAGAEVPAAMLGW